jgi:hypothetical protein
LLLLLFFSLEFFGEIWSHNNIAVKGEEKSVKQTAMLLLNINVVT